MSSEAKEEFQYIEEKFCKDFHKTKEEIEMVKNKYNHSIEEFFDDYKNNHYGSLCLLQNELNENFLLPLMKYEYVNSTKIRPKNPFHFIDKLVRKISLNDEECKYDAMTFNNYHLYFDDLLGLRIILLYMDDWYKIHEYITSEFKIEFDESRYRYKNQRDSLNFKNNAEVKSSVPFIIEKPEIKIRKGDDEELYTSCFPFKDKIPYEIIRGNDYRSIHYTVFYKGYFFELQVRSVFDEAWSEIDHDILYPNRKNINEYEKYSKFINRLSGLSNEMASYFKNTLISQLSISNNINSPPNGVVLEIKSDRNNMDKINVSSIGEPTYTYQNILNEIIKR